MRIPKHRAWRTVVVACAALLSCPASLHASPQSERLTGQGVEHLQAGRYREAIEAFNAAVRADAKDLRPVFYQGVALNRLGAYREALALFTRLEKRDVRHADMDFEIGWSLMGLRRPRECIGRLERFENAQPGRAQTSEFIGRCHLLLGELDKAEAAFGEAVRRDPRLQSTVDLAMAAVEQARDRPDAMRERLLSAGRAETQTGRALRELLGPPPAAGLVAKPLRLGVSFAGGYNDNAIGLGSTIPLPADISRKGTYFVRASLNASYTRALSQDTTGVLGYALLVDRYDDLHAVDLNDVFVYGDVTHRVNDTVGVSFRLSNEFTSLAGERFRNLVTARPAVSLRLTPRSVTEFAYAFAKNDYMGSVPIVFSRDGESGAATVTHLFQVPDTRWSSALSASYTRYRAEGNDFTFDAYGVTGSVRYDFPNRVIGVLGLGYSEHDYANANSVAPPAGFAYARRDEQVLLYAQLVGPLTDVWRWFVQGQRIRNRSNIAFYDFTQNTISAGVAADF